MQKGQGALEYLLLIGGAVLVAVIVITLLLGIAEEGGASATATSTAASNLIAQKRDDILGGTNYAKNHSFETWTSATNPDDWVNRAGSTVTESNDSTSGDSSVLLTPTSTTNYLEQTDTSLTSTFAGNTAKVSFWYKSDAPTGHTVRIGLYTGAGNQGALGDVVPTSSWQRHEYTYSYPGGATTFRIRIYPTYSGIPTTTKIDNLKVGLA